MTDSLVIFISVSSSPGIAGCVFLHNALDRIAMFELNPKWGHFFKGSTIWGLVQTTDKRSNVKQNQYKILAWKAY